MARPPDHSDQVILTQGRIIADGSAEQLARQIVGEDEVRWVQGGDRRTRFVADSTAFARELLLEHGTAVSALEIRRASLEETYLALVREAEAAATTADERELQGAAR